MIDLVRRPLVHILDSRTRWPAVNAWLRGSMLIAGASFLEKAIALLQTVIIARALGVDDYGVYALFFTTAGFIVPIANLQLGYVIIVYVARHRRDDPRRAGTIILLAEILTNASIMAFALPMAVFPSAVGNLLFPSADLPALAILLAVTTALSTKSGIYDCLLQANEAFGRLARLRVAAGTVTITLVAAGALAGAGLMEILILTALAGLVRLVIMALAVRATRHSLVAGATLRDVRGETGLLWSFSLPSALISVSTGFVAWIAFWSLSHTPTGLADVAVLSVALQWRAPAALVVQAFATTFVPAYAARIGAGTDDTGRQLYRANLAITTLLSCGAFAAIAVLAPFILGLYGDGFADRTLLFVVGAAHMVPMMLLAAVQQRLVAEGLMWRNVAAFTPLLATITVGLLLARPTGLFIAQLQLLGWSLALVAAVLATAVRGRGRSPSTETEP